MSRIDAPFLLIDFGPAAHSDQLKKQFFVHQTDCWKSVLIRHGAWSQKAKIASQYRSQATNWVHKTSGVSAKWALRNCTGSGGWYRWWLETGCAAGFGATLPKAGCAWWTDFGSIRISSWAPRWRQHHCSCTATKHRCNIKRICLVVCWSWWDCGMGQFRVWWQQHKSSKAAKACAACLWCKARFCCDPSRYKCGYMGFWAIRGWQFKSPGAAEECSANNSREILLCSNLGRSNRCDMGASRLWWRQH